MGLRLGVVGGGTFGLMHLRAYAQLARKGLVESIALADVDEKCLKKRADQFPLTTYLDYREMFTKEDLNGVSVVTPDHLHREVALSAIEHGFSTLVEKPLDVTVEGCNKIMEAAEQNEVLCQVDFHKRYDPFHIQLRQAIADGGLGVPSHGYAWMEDRIQVPRDWFPHWAPESSPIWFLGTHMIDLYRWCVGRKNATRVWATGQKTKLKDLGIDTYDSIQAHIEFEGGSALQLSTGWVLPEDFEAVVNQGIRIYGSEGICKIDSQDRGASLSTSQEGHRTINPVFFLQEDSGANSRVSGYGVESILSFARNLEFLRDGGYLEELQGTYADASDGLEVTRIARGIHRSLDEGDCIEF